MRRPWPTVLLLLTLGSYTAYFIIAASNQPAVTMVDYWLHMEWARGLSLSDLASWVHPFYAIGYFALLRVGLDVGADVVHYGQFLSGAGSVAMLVAIYLILLTSTRQVGLALAGVVLLLLHPFFRFQALQEGTDMLAAGLQFLSIAVVFVALQNGGGARDHSFWLAALGGLLLGASYLIRYTSLIYLPIVLLCLLWQFRDSWRVAILSCGLFAGAFFLVALPQLAASTAVAGTPFYNEQARNVWFGIYGDFNWTENWPNIPPGITLSQIVTADPGGFASHVIDEVSRFVLYDPASYANDPLALERRVTLWEPLPIHLLWLVGSIFLLFDKRLSRSQIALLLLALWVPVLTTSIAWLFTRYLLVPLAVQAVIMVLAISQISNRLLSSSELATRVSLAALTLLSLLFVSGSSWGVKQERTLNAVRFVSEIQPVLHAAGISQTDQLMSNNRLIQRLDLPEHPQFTLFQQPDAEKTTVAALVQQITGDRDPDLLLFDWTTNAIRTFPLAQYRDELPLAYDVLVPLRLTDDYSLFCVVPCAAEHATPLNIAITPSLMLEGYRAFSINGEVHGLYLYWQVSGSSPELQTINWSLTDASGDVLFQPEVYGLGEPVGGERPLVVDFHLIESDQIRSDETYYLTVVTKQSNDSDTQAINGSIPVQFTNPISTTP